MDPHDEGVEENCISFTYGELFETFRSFPEKNLDTKLKRLELSILEQKGCDTFPVDEKKNLSRFISSFKSKWIEVSRNKMLFLKKYSNWLNQSIKFTKKQSLKRPTGRPRSDFISSSERSKRLKTSDLRCNYTVQELAYATQMKFREEGNVEASKIIRDIMNIDKMAKDYRKALEDSKKAVSKLSSDEAVSLIIEAQLSKKQYNLIRQQTREKNCDIYPSYKKVLQAKQECYPAEVVVKSDIEAEVSLQSLLDHTTKRLLILQQEILCGLNIKSVEIELFLVCKWGCDGSSGQSEYKQKFESANSSDASVFLISLVPIRLYIKYNQSEIIIWQNVRTSSPRFCRPIKLLFKKETTELTNQEKKNIDLQIKKLSPFHHYANNKIYKVNFEMHFTMIDLKVANALTANKSSQACYLCGASSKEFNNISQVISRPFVASYLAYGLSTLHAWIRFFESLLHVAYKIDIQKWQARSSEDKQSVAETKKRIQSLLHSNLGLIVDKPKQGFGSSNDGNTARRFFDNAEIVSKITKIDLGLIKKCHIILQTMSSGYDVNAEKFKKFCLETAHLFVRLYPWYPMPTTLHKVLVHGADIIQHFLVPIGQLSEEAQEARNKDIKRFREQFSRKTSRQDSLKDIFNRLLVSSDPYISSLRKLPRKGNKGLSPEALELLMSPKIDNNQTISDSSDSE